MESWTQDHSGWKRLRGSGANRYDAHVLSSLFATQQKRAKRDKGAARTKQKRRKKTTRGWGEKRGIEAGTSLLSVPNEEERAGIIIKKPH